LQSSIEAEQQRADLLRIGSKRDPNAALNQELAQLDAELAAGRVKLAVLLERFITPERMPGLLQEFLSSHPNLQLHKVSNLRVEEIEGAGVFRHSMIIEMSGGYFAVLRYLQALEESDWAFNWRSLDYVVEIYPRARVRLEIETLSDERSWIGV
jgi:MSHA biogenesis protein MshJ